MGTIRLQLVGEYFYPTDSVSRNILVEEERIERLPENRLDILSPVFVRKGYKIAISNYIPEKSVSPSLPFSPKIGGEAKSVINPCQNCYLRELCDDGECGRKLFRLFSRK